MRSDDAARTARGIVAIVLVVMMAQAAAPAADALTTYIIGGDTYTIQITNEERDTIYLTLDPPMEDVQKCVVYMENVTVDEDLVIQQGTCPEVEIEALNVTVHGEAMLLAWDSKVIIDASNINKLVVNAGVVRIRDSTVGSLTAQLYVTPLSGKQALLEANNTMITCTSDEALSVEPLTPTWAVTPSQAFITSINMSHVALACPEAEKPAARLYGYIISISGFDVGNASLLLSGEYLVRLEDVYSYSHLVAHAGLGGEGFLYLENVTVSPVPGNASRPEANVTLEADTIVKIVSSSINAKSVIISSPVVLANMTRLVSDIVSVDSPNALFAGSTLSARKGLVHSLGSGRLALSGSIVSGAPYEVDVGDYGFIVVNGSTIRSSPTGIVVRVNGSAVVSVESSVFDSSREALIVYGLPGITGRVSVYVGDSYFRSLDGPRVIVNGTTVRDAEGSAIVLSGAPGRVMLSSWRVTAMGPEASGSPNYYVVGDYVVAPVNVYGIGFPYDQAILVWASAAARDHVVPLRASSAAALTPYGVVRAETMDGEVVVKAPGPFRTMILFYNLTGPEAGEVNTTTTTTTPPPTTTEASMETVTVTGGGGDRALILSIAGLLAGLALGYIVRGRLG